MCITALLAVQMMPSQKVEENDKYMQQKVAAQLDRLVGKGKLCCNRLNLSNAGPC